jgi:hypothetical protein
MLIYSTIIEILEGASEMVLTRWRVFWLPVLCGVWVTLVQPIKAGAIYEYTGNEMTSIFISAFPGDVTCPLPCALMGQFTLSSPLLSNYTGPQIQVFPGSWSMTDGTVTLSSSASDFLLFFVSATDTNGLPTSWLVQACIDATCPAASNMSSGGPARPGFSTDTTNQQGLLNPYFAASTTAGSWSVKETTPVPEPSCLLLLTLLGFGKLAFSPKMYRGRIVPGITFARHADLKAVGL